MESGTMQQHWQAGWAAGQAANKSDTAPCSRDDEILNFVPA